MPETGPLVRLRQELLRDIAALSAIAGDLRNWSPVRSTDPVLLGYLAITLHQLYTGLETAFERVCRAVEGPLPAGADAHTALLSDMALELPGLRPAVLRRATLDALRPLLRFRHFVRHAYAVAWDPGRIGEILEQGLLAWSMAEVDLRAFADFLDAVTTGP